VIIDELTAERAKQIGITVGAISHPDIVDVHVALAAAERGHAVLTSDDAGIAGVNPGLVLVHVLPSPEPPTRHPDSSRTRDSQCHPGPGEGTTPAPPTPAGR
jgi:hypothetical protein